MDESIITFFSVVLLICLDFDTVCFSHLLCTSLAHITDMSVIFGDISISPPP